MALGALEPQFWKLFCSTVGRPDWNQPNYFEPGPHQKELQHQVADLFRGKTQDEWVHVFAQTDCCCEPVLNLEEVMLDEQVRQRNMVIELMHEQWGAYRQLGIAPKLSLTPGSINRHAPDLGEHTNEILTNIGISAETLGIFKAGGII